MSWRPSRQKVIAAWYVFAIAVCAVGAACRCGDCADTTQVWELQPYRIEAQLVVDETIGWDEARVQQLATTLEDLARVHVGESWQLTARAASDPVRRAALVLDWKRSQPQFQDLLGTKSEVDKVLVIVLRCSGGRRSVEVWEWDGTAGRWGPAARRRFIQWSQLDATVLESMMDAVSELGLVHSADGRQVVLRLRAGLLPLRNEQRSKPVVGSVFQLALTHQDSARTVIPDGYLIVDDVNRTRLSCRWVGRYALDLDDSERDSLIAIGAKSVHRQTDLVIRNAAGKPLVGCQVSLEGPHKAHRLVGSTDDQGRVPLVADGQCHWVRVQVRDQLLDRIPLLVGYQPEQVWQTRVDEAALAVARLFASCKEDLAVLEARRRVYVARAEARRQRGNAEEAGQLLEQMREAMEAERHKLDEQFNRRRRAVADRFPQVMDEVDRRWSELSSALRDE